MELFKILSLFRHQEKYSGINFEISVISANRVECKKHFFGAILGKKIKVHLSAKFEFLDILRNLSLGDKNYPI